jgi:hypothetical protein
MDYTGIARSNYFRVQDAQVFQDWANTLSGIQVVERDGRFALLADEGWPSSRPEWADDELDIIQELTPHIADGDVAILMAVGYEGMRYVDGTAVAINNQGEFRQVSLHDIYKVAEALAAPGTEITRASY